MPFGRPWNVLNNRRDRVARSLQTSQFSMKWHDISDPTNPQFDELAVTLGIHPLHVEDCRQSGQRAKVENNDNYLFVNLKLLLLNAGNSLNIAHLGLFVSADSLITVHNGPLPLLDELREKPDDLRPDQLLYRLMDGVVESYLPVLDGLEERIDLLQDEVLDRPKPSSLESIGKIRNTLMQLRRVLNDTRHVSFQLRHVRSMLIGQELLPFLRDIHDDLAIDLDAIAGERERLTNALDIYLSSVANRTTEATRTLTLLGTIAVPALVISSLFGMSVSYPAWTKSPWALTVVAIVTAALTIFLLWYLKRNDYLPGGRTD